MWLRRRLIDLNRGAFNGVETAVYELLSAPAVREIVAPVLLDALRERPTGLVLDVGCGSGGLTEDLRRAVHDIVGVDPSLPQLRRLRRRPASSGVAAPAEALPFPDATFAGVVSSCSVKHWPSVSKGLSECVRVLSPGAWSPLSRSMAARTRMSSFGSRPGLGCLQASGAAIAHLRRGASCR